MKIEIYSDVVCPWCYIGKRRLDEVMASDAGDGIEFIWRPYQLFPDLPPEGVDRAAYLRARYGPQSDPARIPERIRIEAADVGIEMNYGLIKKMPNTFDAHRLLESLGGDPRQHELAEILFRSYFCEGLDVGDVAVLADAAAQVGIENVEQMLAGRDWTAAVEEHLLTAREEGISGVPSYVLAGRFTLPGAQSTETMHAFITQAKKRFAQA